MLTVTGSPRRLCSGPTRRDFLQLGAAGPLGLALPTLLRARERPAAAGSFGRARRCLLLFLTGGPPQHDTFDPKPAAPAAIRGALKPIATRTPGLYFSELFPHLARQTEKLCVVRSITHGDRTHTSAGYTMLTGVAHPRPNVTEAADIRPNPNDHPHVGALLAWHRGAGPVPVFAALPEVIKDAAVNTFPGLDGGFLGPTCAPFLIEANPERSALAPPNVVLPHEVSVERLADREGLVKELDRGFRRADAVRAHDAWTARAYDVIRSEPVRRALDATREPPAVRDRYGPHLFGQGSLLARRLLEAGVGLTTVYWHYEGPDDSPVWDTHWNNFQHLRERLAPPTDRAVAALLDDLAERGLLAETLVIVMGEFGRSPKINKEAGRDHWSGAQSILLAGAGIKAGSVYGATDRDGAFPTDFPISPADLMATILHLLGVPADLEIVDRTGRPHRACHGTPVSGVLT